MGRRARKRFAVKADVVVTVLGVFGFLGLLVLARMESASRCPYDDIAYAWLLAFGTMKAGLPWLLKRAVVRRRRTRIDASAVT